MFLADNFQLRPDIRWFGVLSALLGAGILFGFFGLAKMNKNFQLPVCSEAS